MDQYSSLHAEAAPPAVTPIGSVFRARQDEITGHDSRDDIEHGNRHAAARMSQGAGVWIMAATKTKPPGRGKGSKNLVGRRPRRRSWGALKIRAFTYVGGIAPYARSDTCIGV